MAKWPRDKGPTPLMENIFFHEELSDLNTVKVEGLEERLSLGKHLEIASASHVMSSPFADLSGNTCATN